jgi:hypothetical protein
LAASVREKHATGKITLPTVPGKVFPMPIRNTLGLIVLAGHLLAGQARADGFAIDLEVKATKLGKTAHEEMANFGGPPKERLALNAREGELITVHWTLSHPGQNDTAKDVVIHFFVVREAQAGQRVVPKLDKDVIVEGALTMDFKPRDRTEGDLVFVIPTRGCYLIRLENIGAAHGIEEHEQFADLDLVAQ